MFYTAESTGRVSKKDKIIYSGIWQLLVFLEKVQELAKEESKEMKELIWPNCHSMCRGLRIHLGDLIEVSDGFVTGISQYEVVDQSGQIIHAEHERGIEHSWLVLPDQAIVDPFPPGVFATSPLLFPPFGHYQDILPAKVYVASNSPCPFAKTDNVWKKAENIAMVLACHPHDFREDHPQKIDQELLKVAELQALDIVKSLKQS